MYERAQKKVDFHLKFKQDGGEEKSHFILSILPFFSVFNDSREEANICILGRFHILDRIELY